MFLYNVNSSHSTANHNNDHRKGSEHTHTDWPIGWVAIMSREYNQYREDTGKDYRHTYIPHIHTHTHTQLHTHAGSLTPPHTYTYTYTREWDKNTVLTSQLIRCEAAE